VSKYDPERDLVRRLGRALRWSLPWIVAPAALGVFVSGDIDVHALPLIGAERETAVLFLDGQAYFGHLDDSGESGTLVLRDVYYFQDAKGGTTGLPVALVARGQEAHEPADGMRINRDRVLAVERVRPESAVARAIDAERALRGQTPTLSLNRAAEPSRAALVPQRAATEQGIARGFAAATEQLRKLTTELVLPVSRAEAETISDKAVNDLRQVRRNALAALAQALGMSAADADTYVRTTDTRLDASVFTTDAGVLLAPDLSTIVARANALYAQVGDAAAKQLTQPRATTTPSPTPAPTRSPSPTITPTPTPTARP
jgi:hypothetical protein